MERRRQRLLADELLAGAWPLVSIATCRELAGAEGQRRLTVTAVADGDIEAMTLYVQTQRPGPFAVVAMQRAADGSFTGTTADCRAGDRVHYYVEARASSGRLGFAPAGGASGALARRLGK